MPDAPTFTEGDPSEAPVPGVIQITSIDDPRVDVYRDVRDKDLAGRDKVFMAESEMVVRRLVQSTPDRIESLFVSPDRLERMSDVLQQLSTEVPIYVANVDLMTEVAGFHIHRGVLAAGKRVHPCELFLEKSLGHLRGRDQLTILVAERFTNVDNMGALFRNAAAFGVDAIALDPHCCDPLYRKAIRVSMGHVLSLPYGVLHYWPTDLERLKTEWGCTLIGAEITADSNPLWELPHHDRVAIIMGSEATGLSEEAQNVCDAIYQIPMSSNVPSINVSMASSIFLYERQRTLFSTKC